MLRMLLVIEILITSAVVKVTVKNVLTENADGNGHFNSLSGNHLQSQ